jgi:hypothetical protein
VTTHELAAKLLALPDVLVVQSRDPEGNGYSPTHEDLTYDVNFFNGDLVDTDDLDPEGEGPGTAPGVPCLVLWPE